MTYYFTADDPNGDWAEHFLGNNIFSNGVACAGGTWVAVGRNESNNPYISCNSYCTLPAISPDKAYAYIKALEG